MDVTQVRDVMFTTARQTQLNNPDELLPGISESEFGAPEDDYGWGIVDLGKAIYGPGQFFGTFDVTMNGVDDQWDNAITEKAIVLRGVEDANEKATLEPRIAELKAKTTLSDKERWELQYKEKRLAAIEEREAQGYVGKLIKRGNGKLTMTAVNDYSGGTEIHGGTVAGMTESFGSGDVTVKQGATVELHKSFNVTHAGETDWVTTTVTGTAETTDDVNIVLENGSTLALADSGINIQSLKADGTATVTAAGFSKDQLTSLWTGETESIDVSATVGKLELGEGAKLVGNSDYALFDGGEVAIDGNTISTSLKKSDKTVASFGNSSNASAIGSAIEAAAGSAVMGDLLTASADQLRGTLASLSNDFHLAAQNATIVNTALMGRMIKDQANAYGEAQRAELENGATLWAAGMGSWGDVDAGGASVNMDVDYYAGFIGAELPYGNGNKVGVFFGYGQTDFDAGNDGDMDSDDIHIGMYGENDWEKFGLTYGFAYTTQDREGKQSLNFLDQVTRNAIDYNATVFQIFGEASYKGFNTESYQVEPYIGLSWLNVSADDFTQRAGNHSVKTEIDDQNLGLANIGVRGALPFTAGSVAMKVRADVGYMQFFGDKEATAKVTVGDAGTASITGEELSGMGMVGIGLDAAIGKNATFGVNYTGAFGSDITSHGIGAKLGIKF
jgi:subtilase-type serine protease